MIELAEPEASQLRAQVQAQAVFISE